MIYYITVTQWGIDPASHIQTTLVGFSTDFLWRMATFHSHTHEVFWGPVLGWPTGNNLVSYPKSLSLHSCQLVSTIALVSTCIHHCTHVLYRCRARILACHVSFLKDNGVSLGPHTSKHINLPGHWFGTFFEDGYFPLTWWSTVDRPVILAAGNIICVSFIALVRLCSARTTAS